jgi:methionyl-tRNA formyltransferase
VRLVYFGTPDFAVPTLRRLVHDSQFEVALVVTRPDRPAGRGRRPEASPVAISARELGLRCYQPETLRSAEARAPLIEAAADLFVVAAFGLIFGPKTLGIPRIGCVNVHASLLPRYRGAAPIPAAILNGDRETGVTLMRMEAGLDTGPVLGAWPEAIRAADTTESLTRRLADIGANLAVDLLPVYTRGELTPAPQPEFGATLTRPLTKADGWLDWTRPATELERAVRAFWPWPRAWTTDGERIVQVHEAAVVPGLVAKPPGTVIADSGELVVACGEDALRLITVQAAGGKPLSAAQYLAGRRQRASTLGRHGAPTPQPPLIVPMLPAG